MIDAWSTAVVNASRSHTHEEQRTWREEERVGHLVRVLAGKVPEGHFVDIALLIVCAGFFDTQREVVNADRGVVQVDQLRLFRGDGLDKAGLASHLNRRGKFCGGVQFHANSSRRERTPARWRRCVKELEVGYQYQMGRKVCCRRPQSIVMPYIPTGRPH
jgi:hypothetical protein